MLVEFDLPEVSEPRAAVSSYWLRYLFVGTPSQNRQINALASTYMRLTEAAVVEYGLAAAALREVWGNHTSVGLGAMHRSIAHFEACVTDMHRAIAAYRRLRSHRDRDPLSVHVAVLKPSFLSDRVANRVRNMRDAIHHLEEKLDKGEVADGQPIAIKPDGTELPHPSEPGQTIKTFDHLVIGPHELTFADMASWLGEMANVASHIGQFDPGKLPGPDAAA
jgi:hypothetical protein